ncbi:hypothetical protein K466DRAFT_665951 [Polyporus arcularius HHB13444]|uniref:Uncharacterized protein n=1 Tax=Polyporus arcularius HHB13444 TaxID=1314778 RepID=A0A5C3P1X8_9APHY|nr:hypothetical protein K466DRAFT_665951 [Polyporus arcularius HHB13444]
MAPQSRWHYLLETHQPRDALDPEDVGPQHKGELPMYYGWAFTQADLMKYAEYYQLEMPLMECLSAKLGKSSVNYADLSESDAKDEELLGYLQGVAAIAVKQDLENETGVLLQVVRPLSEKYVAVVAMYNHIEANERRKWIEVHHGLDDTVEAIHQSIRETGVKSRPLWWYDWKVLDWDHHG